MSISIIVFLCLQITKKQIILTLVEDRKKMAALYLVKSLKDILFWF